MKPMMRGLGVRVALLICGVLLCLVVMSGLWIDRQLTNAIEEEEFGHIQRQTNLLMSTLTTMMLNGNGTLASSWLDEMHAGPSVLEIEVLDNAGEIAFRDIETLKMVNQYLGEERFSREPGSPHAPLKWISESGVNRVLAGERVFEYNRDIAVATFMMPIPRQDACLNCHGYDTNSLRGAVVFSVSTEDAEKRIQKMRRNLWAIAIFLVLVLGVLLWSVLRISVLKPITSLRDGIVRIAQGDRNIALLRGRKDELGEVLTSFNKMQEALTVSEARIRAVMDNVPEGIVITDDRGRIDTLNPAAERLFQYSAKELIGKPINVLETEGRELEHIVEKSLSLDMTHGEISGVSREVTALRKDGEKFPLEATLSQMQVGEKRYVVSIMRDITHHKEETAALHYKAMHDPLTGIPNRTLFFDRLEHALSVSKREAGHFALIIMDLDRFKLINDREGHHIGDLVLLEVAARTQKLLRKSDTVARLGGDEFAIILPGMDAHYASQVAEKILQSIREPFIIEDKELDLGVSVGVALYPKHGSDRAILMKRADEAMYHAKRLKLGSMVYAAD